MSGDELDALCERLLARALLAGDPVALLQAEADAPDCPDALRRGLHQALLRPDGIRIAALLVARLRFERLLQASPPAQLLFSADPAAFAPLFRRYHMAVPPPSAGPEADAAQFARWLAPATRE